MPRPSKYAEAVYNLSAIVEVIERELVVLREQNSKPIKWRDPMITGQSLATIMKWIKARGDDFNLPLEY